VRSLRLPLESQLFFSVVAGGTTLLAVYVALTRSQTLGIGLPLALLTFLCLVTAFLVWPHWAFALMVPYFAFVPIAKVFVSPWIGATKDVVSFSAVVAAVLLIVVSREHLRPDGALLAAVLLVVVLYVVNVGGGHGVAWLQGVRLLCLPLSMVVVGMTLETPQRSLRWVATSFAATGCVVALYGIVQQLLGVYRLNDLGYTYDEQLRTYNGILRSFGTLDDPFAYAAFLLMALACALFWMRRGPLRLLVGTIIAAGLAASLVRSAALVSVGLLALWLARKGRTPSAALLLTALGALAVFLVVNASGTQTRTYRAGGTADGSASIVTLNGRVGAWRAALGGPADWPFGRGVGEVGTAAARATTSITPDTGQVVGKPVTAVDSGYLAIVADIGIIGFAVFAFLLARLWRLSRDAARVPLRGAWLPLAILVVMLLDATTRSSFTGFPTATLEFLLIGLTLAAARDAREAASARE
jgi:hypothetical protein